MCVAVALYYSPPSLLSVERLCLFASCKLYWITKRCRKVWKRQQPVSWTVNICKLHFHHYQVTAGNCIGGAGQSGAPKPSGSKIWWKYLLANDVRHFWGVHVNTNNLRCFWGLQEDYFTVCSGLTFRKVWYFKQAAVFPLFSVRRTLFCFQLVEKLGS